MECNNCPIYCAPFALLHYCEDLRPGPAALSISKRTELHLKASLGKGPSCSGLTWVHSSFPSEIVTGQPEVFLKPLIPGVVDGILR